MSLIRIMVPVVALGMLAGCSSEHTATAPSSPPPSVSAALADTTPASAAPVASTTAATAPQDGPRPCIDIYVEGAPVTPEVINGQCIAEDSSIMIMGSASYDCTDGSTLGWNDRAWWDDTVHLYPPDAETQTAPADAIAACTG